KDANPLAAAAGDMMQLCAQVVSRDTTIEWLAFIACMSANQSAIPHNAGMCAEVTALELSDLYACVDADGVRLLGESLAYSRAHDIVTSPTVLVQGRRVDAYDDSSPEWYLREMTDACARDCARPASGCCALSDPARGVADDSDGN